MINKAARIRFRLKERNKSNLPRLFVHRTEKHIYASLAIGGKILASASSKELDAKSSIKTYNISGAKFVGDLIGKRALEILKENNGVYFDRGSYVFHGRVKALADEARKYLRF